jgi:oligopeptidase B
MPAPSALRRAVEREIHGDRLVDDYGWLRHRQDPAVMEHLEAENRYAAEVTAHLEGLRQTIFEEIKSKVKETDLSAPARRHGWWYGTETAEGRQYPRFVRWPDRNGRPAGESEVVLDLNALAAGKEFCSLGIQEISPDQKLVAYAVDYRGDEDFTLRFRDLTTGVDLEDVISSTYYGGAWSADGSFFFYSTLDAAHRPFRLWRHRLGTDQREDSLVYEEANERFTLEPGITRDHAFVLVHLDSPTTSEVLAIPATDPEAPPFSLRGRRPGVRYQAEHQNGRWLIVTDEEARNGKVMSYPADDLADEAGTEVIAHDPAAKVARVMPFARHLVIAGRRHGLPSITVIPDGGEPFDLSFEEPAYQLQLGENLEYDSPTVRLEYQSFVTPPRVIDVDLDSGELTVVKETEIPGEYHPADYVQRRIWAPGQDGTMVPVSLVYHRETSLPAPVLVYGYGAYESVIDPWFSPPRFSLLDRGVVYATAHIRGGGEMGRLWHEGGRMAHKHNSFDDFIAVTEHLIAEGIAQPGRIAARGVSAGGLLMGAVTTMRPDLWAVVIAEVPFVDVINTMLDPTIPLTVAEWEEWGDPSIPEHYRWMIEYSPYDNTRPARYPAVLATAGLNDTRVAYWEPAKWVARLREANQGEQPIVLKTEMGAGHSGASGRYQSWREQAFILAFILDRLGIAG